MYSLEELAAMIAKTIVRQREKVIGCISIRPSLIVGKPAPTYYTVVKYILDILAQVNLVKKDQRYCYEKYKKCNYVRYEICRDSELYAPNEEELKRKIIAAVRIYEKERGLG